jgi:3-hydroxybutyryl-CoA dehydratase
MIDAYEQIEVGDTITGKEMEITAEKIQEFAEVTLDFNPLHLDGEFMGTTSFGKTKYEGIIGHGLLNFALVTRMMTDWLWPRGGVHRRLQTKHVKPVYPGDILTPKATVIQKTTSQETRWVLFEVELRKNQGEVVVQGDALAEFPT